MKSEEDNRNAVLRFISRHDVIAWFVSVIFVVAILGGMWGWGNAVGWHAPSGYYYDKVNSSRARFMPEPEFCNETNLPGRSGEQCTASWYYWKLPTDEITVLTRGIVWLFYCLHQVFIWGLLYRAQLVNTFHREKGQKKYGTNLKWFNWALLLGNAFFHVLHLVHSHWTYDGIAQDVSVSSSQGSVIMMLCFILLMEYRDRGFMLMWPNPRSDDKVAKYLRLHPGPGQLLRKYHGYAFSWAIIYTFWYHPMENTWGHTTGFLHTAIVLLQGSLVYTEMHLNRYWRLVNEVWVLLHGTVVAFQTGDPHSTRAAIWPLFTFGFGFILFFTQIFSFPFWKKISAYFRIIPVIVFFAIVVALSGTVIEGRAPGQNGFSRMYEMLFIPAEEYMMFLFSWIILYIFLYIEALTIGDKKKKEGPEVTATKQAAYVCAIVLIYALFVFFSYLGRHMSGNFIVLMIVHVFVFTIGISITIMFSKQVMGPFRKMVPTKSCGKVSEAKVGDGTDNSGFVDDTV